MGHARIVRCVLGSRAYVPPSSTPAVPVVTPPERGASGPDVERQLRRSACRGGRSRL